MVDKVEPILIRRVGKEHVVEGAWPKATRIAIGALDESFGHVTHLGNRFKITTKNGWAIYEPAECDGDTWVCRLINSELNLAKSES